jgi:penicillin-binding protein 1A
MHKVLNTDIAQKMLALLENVVQNGTAQAAKSLGRPIGGKTGTTNDFADAWFVGFSPSITTAIWVGYDDRKTLGDKEAGAVVALPIWINYMQEVFKDKPVEQFSRPENPAVIPAENSGATPIEQKRIFVEDLPGSSAPPATKPPKKP